MTPRPPSSRRIWARAAISANSVTEIRVGANARLDRVKVELESHEATHLAHAHVTLARNVTFRDFTLTTGAKLNRQNGTYRFTGEFTDAKISGAYLLAGKQHADTRLVVDHQVPNCASRELFKCVMDDHARGIFQGKVIVQPGRAEDRRQAVEPCAAAVRDGRVRCQARTRDLCRRRGLRPWRHVGRPEPRPCVLSEVARHPRGRGQGHADRRLRRRGLRHDRTMTASARRWPTMPRAG